MQQIPSRTELGKRMRACFECPDGYTMVGGDYSNMELRLIAEFSDDPVWVSAFVNGEDLHTKLCVMTFSIPAEQVKSPTPFKPGISYRDVQKTLDFGLAYGMSPIKLADTIGVSEEQAKKIINDFFSRVPKVKRFLDMLGNRGKQNFMIRTGPPFRRIRFFEKTADMKKLGEIERASKNMPIQGSCADVVKLALILLQDYITKHSLPVKLVLTVHDEIQCEVPEDYAPTWKPIMEDLMNQAARVVLKKVPIVTDCKISKSWSK